MQLRHSSWVLAFGLVTACAKSDKTPEPTSEPIATTVVEPGQPPAEPEATPPADPTKTTPPPVAVDAGVAAVAIDAGATPTTATPDAGAPAKKASGDLDIVSEGAEPRHLLRYAIPVGTKQKMEMIADVVTETPMGKISMPTMTMKFDLEVTGVDAAGTTTTKLVLADVQLKEKPDTLPGLVEQIEATLPEVEGAATVLQLDASGKVLSIQADQATPDPVLGQALGKDSVGQLYVRMPDVPIGKGAKWKTKGKGSHNGIAVEFSTVYEVKAVTATTAKVKVTTTLKAPKQTVQQAGVELEVVKFQGKNTMTMSIDLTQLVPTTSGSATTAMSLSAQGQAFDLSSKTELTIKPKK
jgi:hypothetical protein